MKNMKYDYSNTQIQMPDIIAKMFLAKNKKLVSNTHIYDKDQGYEDNPHITILYGIHNDEPPLELIDALETYPKFSISLGSISLFKGTENGKPFDVVKTDITSPDLHILNRIVKDTCKYTTDFPNYVPHATIAYVKPDTCDYLKDNPTFKGISFIADRILFSSKNGIKREIFLARR